MSATPLFVIGVGTGLLAGGAGCAAVQAGLLAAAVTRRTAPDPRREVRLRPLAPVGVFLIGKLISHAVLGAALGAFGSAVQIGPRIRAAIMLVAAVLMVFFALELFGLRVARRLAPRPPVAWARLAQKSARTNWMLTPLLLGLVTVLLPCGVTLSMELLAITSATPQGGVAVMAGFVLGTAPLFTVLGYALRKSAQVLRGRLRAATGALIIGVAAFTAASGLNLSGWNPVTSILASGPGRAKARTVSPAELSMPSQVIEIGVRNGSYSPSAVTARAGRRTTLVLRTLSTTSCTRDFVIPSLNIERNLPVTGRTVIDLGSRPAGNLTYTCAMGEHTGVITFKDLPAPMHRG